MIAVGVINLNDMNPNSVVRTAEFLLFIKLVFLYWQILPKRLSYNTLKIAYLFYKKFILVPNGGKYIMKNKFKKALQAAVILSCATLFPWQAMAAEVEEVEEVEYDNKGNVISRQDLGFIILRVDRSKGLL